MVYSAIGIGMILKFGGLNHGEHVLPTVVTHYPLIHMSRIMYTSNQQSMK